MVCGRMHSWMQRDFDLEELMSLCYTWVTGDKQ
jgi:hypothetical protein